MGYMFGLAGGPLPVSGALRSVLTTILIVFFGVYGLVFGALAAIHVAGHVAHLRGIPRFSARVSFCRTSCVLMGGGTRVMLFAMR